MSSSSSSLDTESEGATSQPGTSAGATDGSSSETSTDDDTDGSITTGDASTGTIDPCEGVACSEDQHCVEGECVSIDDGTTGVEPGASYPDPSGGCPEGMMDGNAIFGNLTLNVCVPACDAAAANTELACPQPETGTAVGLCLATGPGSGLPCGPLGSACEDEGEFCITNTATLTNECSVGLGCLLTCQQGLSCPTGMICDGPTEICVYE